MRAHRPLSPRSSYYFRQYTTLFSCDRPPSPNPLFGSLKMQHPWNLDTVYFQRCRNKGGKASVGKVAGGRVYWERATVSLAGNRSPDSTLSKVTSSHLGIQPPPPPPPTKAVAGSRRQVFKALWKACPPCLRNSAACLWRSHLQSFSFGCLSFVTLASVLRNEQ